MITDSGKSLIFSLLTGNNLPLDSIKVGASAGVENPNQVDLQSVLGSINKITQFTTGVSEIVFETSYGYNDANGTIQEVGLFAVDGTLFSRSVVLAQTKTSAQRMKVRVVVRLKRADE